MVLGRVRCQDIELGRSSTAASCWQRGAVLNPEKNVCSGTVLRADPLWVPTSDPDDGGNTATMAVSISDDKERQR